MAVDLNVMLCLREDGQENQYYDPSHGSTKMNEDETAHLAEMFYIPYYNDTADDISMWNDKIRDWNLSRKKAATFANEAHLLQEIKALQAHLFAVQDVCGMKLLSGAGLFPLLDSICAC